MVAMMARNRVTLIALLSALIALLPLGVGCETPPRAASPTVATAFHEREGEPPPGATFHASTPAPNGSLAGSAAVATVNGRPVAASQLVDLLLRSHGPGILEQLVALYAAEDMAKKKGLSVTDKDVDQEFELSLRRLVNPLPTASPVPFDRTEAERLLESVLDQRNISREEFFLPLRRNAYLRKVASTDLTLTDAQLRAEYDRRFGERVLVRHIQLASSAEASRIQERLVAGESFAELATRYSANTASGKNGGLLDPISAVDDEVPENFRRAAFALEPGQISGVVRIGEWYHVLKLENQIAAEQPDFNSVKEELARAVRDRLVEARMRELYEQSLTQAKVDVQDPALREGYERRVRQRTP